MAGKTTGSKRGPGKRAAGEQYTFNSADGTEWLLEMIIGAALTGKAIRVGLTRDGGALAIGVYDNGEYGTEYVRPSENLAEQVREIMLGWGIDRAVYDDEAGCWLLV